MPPRRGPEAGLRPAGSGGQVRGFEDEPEGGSAGGMKSPTIVEIGAPACDRFDWKSFNHETFAALNHLDRSRLTDLEIAAEQRSFLHVASRGLPDQRDPASILCEAIGFLPQTHPAEWQTRQVEEARNAGDAASQKHGATRSSSGTSITPAAQPARGEGVARSFPRKPLRRTRRPGFGSPDGAWLQPPGRAVGFQDSGPTATVRRPHRLESERRQLRLLVRAQLVCATCSSPV